MMWLEPLCPANKASETNQEYSALLPFQVCNTAHPGRGQSPLRERVGENLSEDS